MSDPSTATSGPAHRQTSGLGFVGQSVTRIEDERLLTGAGTFVADVDPPGVLHATFVRSPLPHATITGIDVSAAERVPGVVKVFTGADIRSRTLPFPPFLMLDGLYTPPFWPLSDDKVRMVGDPVALVIAESRYVAEDAAELVEVDYEPLGSVATIADALDPDSARLWDKAEGNVLYDHTDDHGTGDLDRLFADADRVVTERFACHRQANQPMETRGSVVEVDPVTGDLTIHNATQAGHFLRWIVTALTEPTSPLRSLIAFARNGERRRAFLSSARSFLRNNGDSLAASDNAGPRYQLRKNPSLLLNMIRIGTGLLGSQRHLTVKAADVGGAFGSKGAISREDVALVVAAIELNRSVKWIEDRVENLTDGGQAREEEMEVSIALDGDGTFRALKVDLVVDQGAYPGFPITAAFMTRIMNVMWPGAYRWDAFRLRSRVVATNKGRYLPYRGPWANETWVRERIIDVAARAMGVAPTDLRLQNMIGESDMPTEMITGPSLDETMSTRKSLERAIELIDPAAFAAERTAAAAEGRLLGLGFASYHEAAPGPPNYLTSINPGSEWAGVERSRATIEADGSIVVRTSQYPHGQSHQTTYAQVAADEFGVHPREVTVIWGDTDDTEFTFLGTGGSRGGPLGGGSIRGSAREVRALVDAKAAELLEASPDDIVVTDGTIHVAGVPARGLTYAEVAAAAVADRADPTGGADGGPAFEAAFGYQGKGDGGWSCATHACIVEIDTETGLVTFPRYVVVEDCGPIINPAIVDGQIRGAVAQAIGAVLYEKTVYDADGNLQSSTYLDYLVPTAMEIPTIEIHHLETLSPGENDFRGVGEGGMLAGPAAITNAIEDALASRGVTITEQFLPPTRILELAGVIEPDDAG